MAKELGCRMALVPLIAVAAGSLLGCQGNSGDAQWGRYETKLASCQLILPGSHLQRPEPFLNRDRCLVDCQLGESCAELTAMHCGSLLSASDLPLDPCVSSCVGLQDNFTCRNGDTVASSNRCDGAQDCSDGSDEIDCATFSCQNGDRVLVRYRCNGNQDCGDGSDEAGCPPGIESLLTCPCTARRLCSLIPRQGAGSGRSQRWRLALGATKPSPAG
jgi:hypothetical protein